jgi:hypothetical protein
MTAPLDRLIARFEPVLERLEPVIEKIENAASRVNPTKLNAIVDHLSDATSSFNWWLTMGRHLLFWLLILFVILILANIFLVVKLFSRPVVRCIPAF